MFEVFPVAATLRVTEIPAPAEPLPAALRERVEALWAAEQRSRKKPLVNGQLFHVARRGAGSLKGWFVEYRWWVAQLRDPTLFRGNDVRPLGVSGLTWTAQGVVLARRSETMTLDAGRWELAPAGGVDPSARTPGGAIDARAQFLDELEEELNVPRSRVASLRPLALIWSEETLSYDLVLDTRLQDDAAELCARFAARESQEYTEVRVVPRAELAAFLHRHETTSLSRKILQVQGWVE